MLSPSLIWGLFTEICVQGWQPHWEGSVKYITVGLNISFVLGLKEKL